MRDIIKPSLVLFIITLIASASLGVVFEITKKPIQAQTESVKEKSRKELINDATSFVEVEVLDNPNIKSLVKAMKDNETFGYIITVSPKGYSGEINMIVAIGNDSKIIGTKILKHTETPGLGGEATKSKFSDQFVGKSGTLTITKNDPKNDTEINAITSATITSKAYTLGVNTAIEYFQQLKSEGK